MRKKTVMLSEVPLKIAALEVSLQFCIQEAPEQKKISPEIPVRHLSLSPDSHLYLLCLQMSRCVLSCAGMRVGMDSSLFVPVFTLKGMREEPLF